MKEYLKNLWRARPVRLVLLPWTIAFLILQLANTQDGGPNAMSRFLTMRSMVESQTFSIDGRIPHSEDWARTPDGHYYSNKAPGPMLLGFPTFFVLDQMSRIWEKPGREENGLRHPPGYFHKTYTSLLNQVLPLLILMAMILVWLSQERVSRATQNFFVLAVFFGSTVSMYYNNYSGHAFNAILQLGLLYALVRRTYAWAGFFAAAALLSDYSFGAQIPGFVLALWVAVPRKKEFLHASIAVLLGAALPAALWIWYHAAAFGSPFLIANNFQNPVFLDTISENENLWGIFRMPVWDVLIELVFGRMRGLLFTQPWLFALIPVAALGTLLPRTMGIEKRSENLAFAARVAAVYCVVGLAGLLFMNMSFGAWHGGGAAGPRYLSGIFLCFAFWISIELDAYPKWLRGFFWVTLGLSVVFRALVYGTSILGPPLPLWEWYIAEFFKTSKTPHLRFAIFALVAAGAWAWQRKQVRKEEAIGPS